MKASLDICPIDKLIEMVQKTASPHILNAHYSEHSIIITVNFGQSVETFTGDRTEAEHLEAISETSDYLTMNVFKVVCDKGKSVNVKYKFQVFHTTTENVLGFFGKKIELCVSPNRRCALTFIGTSD